MIAPDNAVVVVEEADERKKRVEGGAREAVSWQIVVTGSGQSMDSKATSPPGRQHISPPPPLLSTLPSSCPPRPTSRRFVHLQTQPPQPCKPQQRQTPAPRYQSRSHIRTRASGDFKSLLCRNITRSSTCRDGEAGLVALARPTVMRRGMPFYSCAASLKC